jgi:hypothetical protein
VDPNALYVGLAAGRKRGVRHALALSTAIITAGGLSLSFADAVVPVTVRDVLERAPQPLPEGEVRALVGGAAIATRSSDGRGFSLTNRDDGTVSAVRDRTGLESTSGVGRWFVRDGRYCALLRWQTAAVSFGDGFCFAVHRVGDAYFGVRESDLPESPATPLKIRGR